MKIIDDYFLNLSDNISFIELKEGSYLNVNDCIINDELPLAMVTSTLVNEIKDGAVEEEFKVSQLVEGAIYTLGIDPDFKYREEYVDVLYSFNPNIEDYILYKGLKYIKENEYENASVYFRALVNINPENIEAVFNYALCLERISSDFLDENDERQAKVFLLESTKHMEAILELDPEYLLAHYKLGYHYKYYKQFLKAKLTWKEYIKLSKDQGMIQEIRDELEKIEDDVEFERGLSYLSRGEHNLALEIYLSLLSKYKKSWDLFYLTGLSYKGLGNYENAISYFQKAINIDSEDSDAYNELGICLVGIGRMEEGIEAFDEGVEKDPKDYKILFNRGMTYLESGLVDQAKEDIEAAYKLNPENDLIKGQLDNLNVV